MTARFFVDENDLALGRALREVHSDVVYPGHPDIPEVPRGALDDEWLPVVALLRLVVITRDQRIRYRPVEKHLWLEHRVRGFVLTGRASQSTADSLAEDESLSIRELGSFPELVELVDIVARNDGLGRELNRGGRIDYELSVLASLEEVLDRALREPGGHPTQ